MKIGRAFSYLAIALGGSLGVAGCAKDPEIPNAPIFYPVSGSMDINRVTRIAGTDTSYSENVTAAFNKPVVDLPPRVFAGDVLLNGTQLTRHDQGSRYYGDSAAGHLLPILEGGRFNVWRVTGSADMPGFIDSVATPSAGLTVTAPSAADTISLSSVLTVRWANAGEKDVRIVVTILAVADTFPGYMQTSILAPNTGAFSLTPSQMRSIHFAPGPMVVTVTKGMVREGLTAAPDVRRYVIGYSSKVEIHAWFRE